MMAQSDPVAGDVFVALGANLPSPGGTSPMETCRAAVVRLSAAGIRVTGRSSWYATEPVGEPGQPWFVNGVVRAASGLGPEAILAALHRIEAEFGRVRERHWAARTLDLDLIDCRGLVRAGAPGPILPHPRLAERRFVLAPLAELAPGWRHPVTGATAQALLDRLPARPEAVRLAGQGPSALPQGAEFLDDRGRPH
ncbi:2-amino-4-hydroxy-6-hydroxymethyldihydropteridine diphosphokinase [Stella humosa]|uniref:2-amino-4-hydroxy-6-hydroxymethyldihydropteridine pyrophosphokinase n=1 Tax=Stella humosa TaxID=94 RepID=A0A3N1KPM0_9PROT|nr:2-amino-4-hydroxy-6-hydroxymethyldihydropteridine diphosphokinase [Stella humosa]ROP81242.1 2-amino-4-hydroxy-6-hydroxymethyldihydropteridine diphosphokinase [Stella humosa]BBK32590.1 7,8-dihydro-6-hydroxymethylpterin-pyrophosphokina se [Stella humosa]